MYGNFFCHGIKCKFISFQSSDFFLRIVGLYLKTASRKPGICKFTPHNFDFFVRIQNLHLSFLHPPFPINICVFTSPPPPHFFSQKFEFIFYFFTCKIIILPLHLAILNYFWILFTFSFFFHGIKTKTGRLIAHF